MSFPTDEELLKWQTEGIVMAERIKEFACKLTNSERLRNALDGAKMENPDLIGGCLMSIGIVLGAIFGEISSVQRLKEMDDKAWTEFGLVLKHIIAQMDDTSAIVVDIEIPNRKVAG